MHRLSPISLQKYESILFQQRNSAVFRATNNLEDTYDAYEKDISIVSFYFEESKAFEYIR